MGIGTERLFLAIYGPAALGHLMKALIAFTRPKILYME